MTDSTDRELKELVENMAANHNCSYCGTSLRKSDRFPGYCYRVEELVEDAEAYAKSHSHRVAREAVRQNPEGYCNNCSRVIEQCDLCGLRLAEQGKGTI